MDQSVLKDFSEMSLKTRHSSATDNLEDSCYGFTSSDESFDSNTSSSSSQQNDSSDSSDLSQRDSKPNESKPNEINTNSGDHKSFVSIMKRLKNNIKRKSEKSKAQPQSILRRPQEYVFVRGMSGLPLRVKAPQSSSCHLCVSENSAIS